MYNVLTSIAAMVFVLGIMILVHEWGHYAAAKLLGVRVEVFAIGFGPRLVGFKRGETDYRIAALPFGGYVKMAGENPLEGRTGDPGEFLSHPRWHRFIIAAAGPAMNILLAVALLTVVYMVHYQHPAYLEGPAVIGDVEDQSPAARAGIKPGDRIVRVENKQNPNWEDVILAIALSPNNPVNMALQRDSQILDVSVTPQPQGPNQVGDVGFAPSRPVIVGSLERGMPAEKAGLQTDDVITAVNGQPVLSIQELIRTIQKYKSGPVEITVERNGQPKTLSVIPVEDDKRGEKAYRLGFVNVEKLHVDKLPFATALSKSIERNKQYSLLIVELVQKMISRKVSIKQVEGPIGIGRAAGEAARQKGWTPLLELMAMISLNLGIFNLFPIPIMDGGVILLLAIEGIMRRDISQAVKERIYQAAFVFLILFAALVLYNDLLKAVPGLASRLP